MPIFALPLYHIHKCLDAAYETERLLNRGHFLLLVNLETKLSLDIDWKSVPKEQWKPPAPSKVLSISESQIQSEWTPEANRIC